MGTTNDSTNATLVVDASKEDLSALVEDVQRRTRGEVIFTGVNRINH